MLDLADAAAERLGLYDIDQVLPDARELAAVLVAQRREDGSEVVRGLRTFRRIRRWCSTAAARSTCSRTRPTRSSRRAMAELFRRGSDPLTVMKWKEIIDLIESATDRAEDVANVIEGVVLEHA